MKDDYIIPITQLSHITHEKEAEQIDQGSYFKFKPKAKFGRDWSIGKTFQKCFGDDAFTRISTAEQVFPGCLSWWGISLRAWYKDNPVEKFGVCCDLCSPDRPRGGGMCARNHVFKPGYLNNPPYSTYGDVEFTVSWNNIMESYMQSREAPNIYLSIAGTLRYNCEICYVVMVVTSDDLDTIDKSSIFRGQDEQVIDPNFCMDGSGKLLLNETSPNFRIRRPISWIRGEGRVSWEQLVFAFYFPDDRHSLQCPEAFVSRNKVNHHYNLCALKKQKIKCPCDPRIKERQ